MDSAAAQESSEARGKGLSFYFDPEAKALLVTVEPDDQAAPVDEAWLKGHLAEVGYGALRYLPTAAMVVLAKYNSAQPLAAFRLAEAVDASLDITVANDFSSASLFITPAEGGAPVTKEQVVAALAEKGIVEGILVDAINGAIASSEARGVVIARGRLPVNGQDGRLESLLPAVRSRVPKVDASGFTDYRDLGEIFVVHPGEPLMRRHPPTDGVAGATLQGVPIPPKPGKPVLFAARLEGVSFAPDDPDLLQAAIVGQPVEVPGGMMVEPVYTVESVNTASGNVEFDGSVVVRGDVSAGMTIRAKGDIEVGGVVEVATLDAGGSILVKGGVMGSLGRKESGEHHVVRCGGSFHANYAQQARIEAADSIFIDDVAMQCELSAINHIRVGDKRRGHIIGGRAQATLSITAKVIGSPNRVITHCEIGVNPAMHKHLLELAKIRDGKETQLLEVSKLLDFASHHPGRVPPPMLEKARHTAAALGADIAALREEQDGINHKIELSQQARVVAQQALYEGVEVHVGNLRYRVSGEHGPCQVGLGPAGLGMVQDEPEAG